MLKKLKLILLVITSKKIDENTVLAKRIKFGVNDNFVRYTEI